MDDLTTPAKSPEIIIPKDTYTTYVYNTKWNTDNRDTITIVFKLTNPADLIMIDNLKITPLLLPKSTPAPPTNVG